MTLADHSERYVVMQNKYGGYEVVNQNGARAKRPYGFNRRDHAETRAAALNRAEGAAAASLESSEERG